jgi:hypothetical protein
MPTTGPRRNEKYLAGLWIIEASDLDVALKLPGEAAGRASAGAGVQGWLRRVGSPTTGVPESP